MEDYTPIPYPKCLYHPEKGVRVVADEAEHEALGPGWAESPGGEAAAVKKARQKKEKPNADSE